MLKLGWTAIHTRFVAAQKLAAYAPTSDERGWGAWCGRVSSLAKYFVSQRWMVTIYQFKYTEIWRPGCYLGRSPHAPLACRSPSRDSPCAAHSEFLVWGVSVWSLEHSPHGPFIYFSGRELCSNVRHHACSRKWPMMTDLSAVVLHGQGCGQASLSAHRGCHDH